mgnify:CR=1 FL=1
MSGLYDGFLTWLRDPIVRASFFALVFWIVGLVVARLVVGGLARAAAQHVDAQRVTMARRIAFYALAILVTLAALDRGGIDMSVFFGAAGILTVAFGFAAQTSMSNLISGIFLIGERAFVVGDWITVGTTTGEVLSIEYSPAGAEPATQAVSQGRAVLLDDLQFQGLKDESARDEKARQFDCPHCGSSVQVALDTTKSITCRSCNSIIDLSQGIGGELRHAEQDEPVKDLIPLGATGQLQGVHWQVVGFQHRMGQEPGDDEQFGWDEYLLYNRKRGFSFLVDSTDGWSMVKPATGAPTMAGSTARTATYLGTTYALQYSYNAETTYVAGEFYWPVSRGQKTFNRDFASAKGLLSLEQTPNEVTWSVGSKIGSNTVAEAFGLKDQAALFKRDDVKPFSASPQIAMSTIVLFVILILVVFIMSSCISSMGSSGGGYRSSGGSYGGYSSGGGHK